MIIDPRHLEQISTIVQVGTLQGAADKIGTSQPALSRMIRTLESRIGQPIFERDHRPLRPTSLGLELAGQGRAILIARERAVEMVDQSQRGVFGVLKIGAPPFICERLVAEAISDFLAKRPNIRIDLFPDYFPELHRRLFQNEIDIIVGPAKAAGPQFSNILMEPLLEDRNLIVGRAGHPILSGEITDNELSAATWVGHSDRSMLRHDMETALRLLGVRDLRFAFQSESAGAVMELVRRSDYLTVLPRYAVRNETEDSLAILPVSLPTADQTISIMSRINYEETKLITEFKAHLRAHVSAFYSS